MFDHIERIRRKPEHVRRRILFISVGFIMACIIFLWVVSFPIRFGVFYEGEKDAREALSPFIVLDKYIEEFGKKINQSANSLGSVITQ